MNKNKAVIHGGFIHKNNRKNQFLYKFSYLKIILSRGVDKYIIKIIL